MLIIFFALKMPGFRTHRWSNQPLYDLLSVSMEIGIGILRTHIASTLFLMQFLKE